MDMQFEPEQIIDILEQAATNLAFASYDADGREHDDVLHNREQLKGVIKQLTDHYFS